MTVQLWKTAEGGQSQIKGGKGIICKMLGTWLEAPYWDSKNNNKRELYLKEEIKLLKATELILSLKMEHPQNQLKEESDEEKVGGKHQVYVYVGFPSFWHCID